MDDWGGLENRCGLYGHRGFESHPLRLRNLPPLGVREILFALALLVSLLIGGACSSAITLTVPPTSSGMPTYVPSATSSATLTASPTATSTATPTLAPPPIVLENAAQIAPLGALDAGGMVNALALSPDGAYLAAAVEGGIVQVWDAASGNLLMTLDDVGSMPYGMAFSPGGSVLAVGAGDVQGGSVTAWSIPSGDLLYRMPFGAAVASVHFRPDGAMLAAGSRDGTLALLDVRSGMPETILNVGSAVWALAYTPDGAMLVTGSEEGRIRYWDAASGEALYNGWVGHEAAVRTLAVSADSLLLASGGEDAVIKLYDLFTARVLRLMYARSTVLALAFNPQATLLASGEADGTLRLWDVVLGEEIAAWAGAHKPQGLRALVWSADGTTLFSAGGDGFILWWRAPAATSP